MSRGSNIANIIMEGSRGASQARSRGWGAIGDAIGGALSDHAKWEREREERENKLKLQALQIQNTEMDVDLKQRELEKQDFIKGVMQGEGTIQEKIHKIGEGGYWRDAMEIHTDIANNMLAQSKAKNAQREQYIAQTDDLANIGKAASTMQDGQQAADYIIAQVADRVKNGVMTKETGEKFLEGLTPENAFDKASNLVKGSATMMNKLDKQVEESLRRMPDAISKMEAEMAYTVQNRNLMDPETYGRLYASQEKALMNLERERLIETNYKATRLAIAEMDLTMKEVDLYSGIAAPMIGIHKNVLEITGGKEALADIYKRGKDAGLQGEDLTTLVNRVVGYQEKEENRFSPDVPAKFYFKPGVDINQEINKLKGIKEEKLAPTSVKEAIEKPKEVARGRNRAQNKPDTKRIEGAQMSKEAFKKQAQKRAAAAGKELTEKELEAYWANYEKAYK